MDGPLIRIDHVTREFHLAREKTDSIKEHLLRKLRKPVSTDVLLALNDVTFSVCKGEAVALVGVNGSGKSTLLKTVAGVLKPSRGTVEVHGTIAPLIELGAGFDFDLTARENIFLNGAVLGHNRRFMEAHFNDIMDFAELWDFVDVPLKNFSTGMVARLGFSIATEVAADILIVDEILSVGDEKFQQKCAERINRLLSGGTTLLMVSHSTSQVRSLCRRAILLDHGRILMDASSDEVCDEYSKKI